MKYLLIKINEKNSLIKLLFIGIFIFFSFYYLWKGSKNISIHYDEFIFLKRSYFFDLYKNGDFSNPLWHEFDSYDTPKLAEYLYFFEPYSDRYVSAGDFENRTSFSNKFDAEWFEVYMNNDMAFSDFEPDLAWRIKPIMEARKVAIFMGVLSLLAIIIIGHLIGDIKYGFIASILLLSNFLFRQTIIRAMGDSPLLLFMLLTLVISMLFVGMIEKKKNVLLILMLMGISFGLALSTKLNGILSIIFVGCFFVYLYIRKKVSFFYSLVAVSFVAFFGFIIFYLLNPFIWSDPFNKFNQMVIHRNKTIANQQKQFDNFKLFSLTDKFKYVYKNLLASDNYYPTLSLAESKFPPMDLAFLLIGIYCFYRDINRKKYKNSIFQTNRIVLLLWCLVIGGITTILIPLDWDRYYLPILVCLIFFEAKGASLCLDSVFYYLKHYDQQ